MEWLALIVPPAIWFNTVFAKTRRSAVSFALSIISGMLAVAYLKSGAITLFICFCCALVAMLSAMFTPPMGQKKRHKPANKPKGR